MKKKDNEMIMKKINKNGDVSTPRPLTYLFLILFPFNIFKTV